MPKRKWLLIIPFFAMLVITLLVGYAGTDNATAQTSGDAQKKLVMVTSADYPPYEFRDTATGKNEIIGFDIDIAKYITKELESESYVQRDAM